MGGLKPLPYFRIKDMKNDTLIKAKALKWCEWHNFISFL